MVAGETVGLMGEDNFDKLRASWEERTMDWKRGWRQDFIACIIVIFEENGRKMAGCGDFDVNLRQEQIED